MDNILSAYNNVEHFNSAPVSGGFKISRSRNITIQNSSFDINYGVGVWVDESSYDTKIVNNTMVNNTKHGISIEISAKTTIANNYIARNSSSGIKINDVNGAKIYNNTITDNIGRPLNIVQDTRRATNLSTPGHDTRQKLPDATVTWINSNIVVSNNILGGTTNNYLLCVEDYSKTFTAAQIIKSTNGNVYQRDTATTPAKVIIWSGGTVGATTYKTVADFSKSIGQETTGLELTGAEAVTPSGTPTASVTNSAARTAQALPADLASLIGQPVGTKHLGVFR